MKKEDKINQKMASRGQYNRISRKRVKKIIILKYMKKIDQSR